MAQQYANKQPQGYNNYIKNVAIIGAGGQVGKFLAEALQRSGKHNVTAITRSSSSSVPSGLSVKQVDYDDHSSLVSALQGQEALIITMAVTAPLDTQSKIVKAAAEAKVQWILPNEWGVSGANAEADRDILLGAQKKKEREYIEELGVSSWIGISCGFWYEFSLSGSKDRYGFDFDKKEVRWFDDGNTKLSTSTWPLTGQTVANLLALKILPDDENDKSTTISSFRNRYVFVASFTLTQREMFESVLRVTGDKESDWKFESVDVKQYYRDALAELQKGNQMAFVRVLYGRMFYPEAPGNVEGHLDNEKLGLPKEDLDEFTKIAVKLAEESHIEVRTRELFSTGDKTYAGL